MNTAQRALAVQHALEKYRDTSFKWGARDCIKCARTVGAKLSTKPLPKMPPYSSELTAIRRLKEKGHDTIESLLSAHCIEIPPAMGMTGDIGTIKGNGHLSAVVVSAGGVWLGWAADHPVFGALTLTPERVFRFV